MATAFLPPPPDGFTLDGVLDAPPPPVPRQPSYVPVPDGRAAALSVYPNLQITQVERDPNSALGRLTPNSWHVRSHAAIDARPVPGMTFDDYIQGYRDHGYQILQAIDEVNHPSRHATGPHWHAVLAVDPSNPPLDPSANQSEQSGDSPPDALPPPPAGFTLEAPPAPPRPAPLLNIPRPPLGAPSGVGTMAQAAAPPNPLFQDAASSLAPPPAAPGVGNGLTLNRAGITANERDLTAGAPPPPTGYQDDPANVATQHQALASEVPTAQMTTRPNPRLAGLNDQVRAMALDPSIPTAQIEAFITSRGVPPQSIPGWGAFAAWRDAPASAGPQRSLAAWLQLPARQRGRQGVQLDLESLPTGQYREVTAPENVPQGSIRNYDPTWSERAGTAMRHVLAGDQRGSAVDQEIAGNFESGARFAGADVAQSAYQHAQAAQQAQMQGHPVTAAGHQLAAGAETAMLLPVFRRAEEGAQLARPALAEIERLAMGQGIRDVGPSVDDVIARIATQHFSSLSPDTQDVLRSIIQPSPGEAVPDAITAAHISDLRSAANPPPTLLQRGVQAIRDRFGGGGAPEPAPALPAAAEADALPPPPAGFTLDQTARTSTPTPPLVIDSAALRAAASDQGGRIDLARAGAVLRQQAQAGLDAGRPVTLHIEGRPRTIVATSDSGLVDEHGQSWGSMPILSPSPNDPARLEIGASDGRSIVGELPREGVAPANVGTDGRLYVGGMGESHADVIQRFPEGVWSGETGFVTPDGQFLNRTEALDHVTRNGERIRPSENMRGGPGGNELDALDYRDQSQMVPPPEWSTRRAEWERQAALRQGSATLPARIPDRIDVSQLPPPPPGFTLEEPLGRVQPLGEQPSPETMADTARSIRPEDVLPIPGNRVETAEEAAAANPGTFRNVQAPDPATMLQMGSYQRLGGGTVRFRGPLDAESFLRLRGGLQDEGGDLRAIGITNNAGRPEATGEARLGPILNRSSGMTLDRAGEALHEAGYFRDRPTTGDVLDMLTESRRGNRLWHDNDLGEVAGFQGAQAQRDQADAAAQAGAPLAERIGSPVGPADLSANEPPATAYEDLPRIGGTVGNINLANIESGADIGRLLQNVEQQFGGFGAARRGTISHAETRALADELGMTADDLLRRRPGQALNAEQALAARQLLAKSSDEVIALAAKATGPEASDVSRAAFSEALLRHAAIHEQVTGATAEAGRALSAMRAGARSSAISGNIHQAAIAGLGGQKRLEEVAQGIINLHREGVGPGQVNRFAVQATQPRFRDKLVELWYNSLLSGPRTHAVNILSNMMTAGLQIPEHAAAAGLGLIRRGAGAAIGRADDFDRVMGSEIGQRTFGLLQGTRDGLRAFADTMRTGEVADHVTKVEARTQHAISGVKGSILRIPTRALAAEDEFFKSIGRRMELNGLAVRQARSEGLRGEALANRIADLSANPTDDMVARSLDYARYITFQRPLPPDSMAAGISRFTQNHPWMKLFVPFVRTPANLLKFAVERSPAAPLLRTVRDDFRAGGARRDLAVARMMLGTGLGITVAELASRGIITGGGPADTGARDLMLADGWQPYSIRIGDTYVSYARMDPISTTLGVAADLVDFRRHMTPGQRQQAAPLLIASMVRNLGNKTWLSGISDVVAAIDDPQRSLPNMLARLGGSIAVPALVSQTAGVLDPTMRDTHRPTFSTAGLPQWMDDIGLHSLIDQTAGNIQSRIPGVSPSLPARQDVWGNAVQRGNAIGPDIISPFSTSTARNDPINAELLRLGVNIGHPATQVHVDGVAVPLTTRQRADYGAMSGRYMRDDLRAALADPSWQDMTREEQVSAIAGIKRTARADARADLGLDGSAPPAAALPPPPPGFQLSH